MSTQDSTANSTSGLSQTADQNASFQQICKQSSEKMKNKNVQVHRNFHPSARDYNINTYLLNRLKVATDFAPQNRYYFFGKVLSFLFRLKSSRSKKYFLNKNNTLCMYRIAILK